MLPERCLLGSPSLRFPHETVGPVADRSAPSRWIVKLFLATAPPDWYASLKLSFRDLVIMIADRGISVAHTTILRWVQHYLPEFEKRWKRYARPVGGSC